MGGHGPDSLCVADRTHPGGAAHDQRSQCGVRSSLVVFIVCPFAARLWQQVGVARCGGVEQLDVEPVRGLLEGEAVRVVLGPATLAAHGQPRSSRS